MNGFYPGLTKYNGLLPFLFTGTCRNYKKSSWFHSLVETSLSTILPCPPKLLIPPPPTVVSTPTLVSPPPPPTLVSTPHNSVTPLVSTPLPNHSFVHSSPPTPTLVSTPLHHHHYPLLCPLPSTTHSCIHSHPLAHTLCVNSPPPAHCCGSSLIDPSLIL